jgi:PAS domain S-box-containing protein
VHLGARRRPVDFALQPVHSRFRRLEQHPMLEDMVARARRGEGQFAYEHRIVISDGSLKYIHLVGHTVHGANGRLEYIGAAQDVTQRRLAEEQLRERELNLRRITETIPGMLWSATPAGEVDYCNRPWLEFAAMTEEQAKGWGWATAIYPNDRDGLIESWHSSLASGIPLDLEARMRRFDGAYRWFLFRANPLRDESGNIIKWYGTNTDIEDRRRGEDALRASELSWRQIIDNVPGFVHTTSAIGEVEFISRQTIEYFGKTKEELKDWSRLDIVHPDDLPHLARLLDDPQGHVVVAGRHGVEVIERPVELAQLRPAEVAAHGRVVSPVGEQEVACPQKVGCSAHRGIILLMPRERTLAAHSSPPRTRGANTIRLPEVHETNETKMASR